MSARDSIENLWDRATPVRPLLDAYRDEVALDMGRDLLRDGLKPFLVHLVGPQNAARLLADAIGGPITVTADGEQCPRTGCRIRSAHGHGRGRT